MMSQEKIVPITMPKWGLSMTEGKVIEWLVDEGVELKPGDPVMEIETEKIANTFEALDPGTLRRKVAAVDDVLPIGALLGVLAPAAVSDADIDAYVADFLARYVPPAAEEGDAGPAYQWVDAGGCRVRYAQAGDTGPAVVLVHGFGGDCDNWLFNQNALAAAARVYALDLPGHGESSKQVADASVEGLARTVLAFMDALDIGQAHLVGHSYLRGFIAAESRRDLKPLLQQLVANPDLVNRQMIDDILKFKRLDGVGAALDAIARGFVAGNAQTVDLRGRLAGVQCPIQVLWGRDDRIIPAAQAAGLPGTVACHVLDGSGHLVHMEAASAVNALLLKAVQS